MKKSVVKKTALARSFGAACVLGAVCGLMLFSSCSNGSSSDSESDTGSIYSWSGNKNYKSSTTLPALSNQSENLEENWWRNSTFYHIWIKSFKDSDENDCYKNCGDFKGIEDSLDYIKNDLGCDAIWLSPFYECTYKGSTNAESADMNMHGYDVENFYKVNPYFGTGDGSKAEEELDSLIKACHTKGIKIIFDFIPNHTSSENQWFKDSIKNKNEKRNWYLWSDKDLGDKTTYNTPAWTKAPKSEDTVFVNKEKVQKDEYYYATFTENMPDLNYRNWEVREEMKNVVRYWLNKGFDGLRIDGARHLVENETSRVDTPETHAWFAELRKVIDEYESPKFMVCEAWIDGDRPAIDAYFGTDEAPEFNMVFDFDQGRPMGTCVYYSDYNISYTKDNITTYYNFNNCLRPNPSENKTYGTFLCNHDQYQERLGSFFGEGTSQAAILATAFSLLRPTVPFIYYGNEVAQALGNQNYDFAYRQPLKWNLINKQKTDENSLLNINKKLIAFRNSAEYHDLFTNGKVQTLNLNMTTNGTTEPWRGEVGYIIENNTKKLLVIGHLGNYSERCLWFKDFGVSQITDYSLLIGNKDTYINFDYADGLFKTYDYAPYEIRVYDLTSSEKECILDVWDYDFNSLYFWGSINNWNNSYQMDYDKTNDEFSIEIQFNEPKSGEAFVALEFKLDECGDWAHALGAVSNDKSVLTLGVPLAAIDKTGIDTNFKFTPPSAGTYRFIYSNKDRTIMVSKE